MNNLHNSKQANIVYLKMYSDAENCNFNISCLLHIKLAHAITLIKVHKIRFFFFKFSYNTYFLAIIYQKQYCTLLRYFCIFEF